MDTNHLRHIINFVKQFETLPVPDRIPVLDGLRAYFANRNDAPPSPPGHAKKWIPPTSRVINGKVQHVRGYWASTDRRRHSARRRHIRTSAAGTSDLR